MKDDVFQPLTTTNLAQRPMARKEKKKRVPLWDMTGRPFLMGPVSVEWLARVSTLGLGATLVGLECWYRAGLTGSAAFRLNLSRLAVAPQLARTSAGRGLKRLGEAGLVTVVRPVGQRPLIAIKVPPRELGPCKAGELDRRGGP